MKTLYLKSQNQVTTPLSNRFKRHHSAGKHNINLLKACWDRDRGTEKARNVIPLAIGRGVGKDASRNKEKKIPGY